MFSFFKRKSPVQIEIENKLNDNKKLLTTLENTLEDSKKDFDYYFELYTNLKDPECAEGVQLKEYLVSLKLIIDEYPKMISNAKSDIAACETRLKNLKNKLQ